MDEWESPAQPWREGQSLISKILISNLVTDSWHPYRNFPGRISTAVNKYNFVKKLEILPALLKAAFPLYMLKVIQC